jgi:hypothetical protein
MHEIKHKAREDILEEAYQYLELDVPGRVEQKKKGVQFSFITEGTHP